MKAIILSAVCAVLIGGAVLVAAEGKSDAPTTAPSTQPAASGKPINTLCPVEGDKIDPKITTIYDGKVIGFCCDDCPPVFKKNPEKYMAKLK
jgi:YHS domain-containing protein